ncbi:FecCD family ABC transporter permease [Paeniglutamicibacter gangotriensis]|uniref:Putative ferrichrome import ABC transporter permease n=1 Tax=Paeniglutamicibacter gangotriensis Lz1y TaxID=1276920 RepID=M7MN43_9MICC|nr:iron chelate uptake ABC transporter family permease subunit [Paeniglutamicibacter gangotriensis]EMQ97752.1 putative ferrichrome import ABC transporter permease [Paeniglutamicibacter gangotriensis Lz1y]
MSAEAPGAAVTVPGRARRLGRETALCLVLSALAVLFALLVVGSGDYPMGLGKVINVILGGGEGLEGTIVFQWRAPRAVAALAFGAALGVAGAVFQSLTRNPLGSPDIIGFSTGAYTGALLALTLVGGSFLATSLGALAGGLATALTVYFLAWRRGSHGFRLILVGIGVSAMLAALNQWLVLRAEIEVAMAAAVWGAGTLNGVGWPVLIPALIAIVPVLGLTLAGGRNLGMLELGDDTATALGVRVEPARLVLIVLAVLLTSAATAVAGPIAFVALVAPQLAKRLNRAAGMRLAPAACMGALLLVASDLVAQRVFAPVQLPVGVVTVSIGGIYLIWLLSREGRAAKRA